MLLGAKWRMGICWQGENLFACFGGNCFEIVGAWILSVEIPVRSAVCVLIRKKQSALC